MSKKKHVKKKKLKTVWIVIYILLIVASISCIAFLMFYLFREQKETRDLWEKYELLAEQVVESESFEIPEEEGEIAALPIDFATLQEINPEIYAWIRIPDTNVDYPILQRDTDDQDFYLDHDMYRDTDKAGSIYTEWYNRKDFMDPNTIIYGHNMKNGSMFHNLRYFADEDYFNEHEDMYIYLPDKILCYRIFTSYEFDDRHLLGSYNFYDHKVFEDYIEEITHPRSMYVMLRDDCEVTSYDRIVTLSTCVGNKPTKRRLVQAVLTDRIKAEYRGAADDGATEENSEAE